MFGREENISSPQFARKELLSLKGLNLEVVDIPEAGHVVPMEKPKEVATATRDFLSGQFPNQRITSQSNLEAARQNLLQPEA